jgi:methionyl-tRNA synthetase
MESQMPGGVIQYDDFAKLDLRVGTVLEAAPHPNADKLLVLKVDLGKEHRTLVAGIRAYYAPEALVGRQVIVVANLAPRAMRGVESQGMVLAGSTDDRSAVILLTPEKPLPPGSKVS